MRPFISEYLNHIEEDNKVCDQIYYLLYEEVKASKYDKYNNLISIFFFDLLKFLTGTILRSREIKNKIDPKVLCDSLHLWPYAGFKEIKSGHFDLEQLVFSKELGFPKISIQKNIIQTISKFTSIIPLFGKRKTIGFLNSSLDKAIATKALLKGYRVEWIDQKWLTKDYPDLSEQLESLSKIISKVCKDNGLERLADDMAVIFQKRITTILNSIEKKPKLPKVDYILACSGVDIKFRLCSSLIHRNKVKAYNIIHGDAYAVVDNPLFGIGELFLSTGILGYGENYNLYKDELEYIKEFNTDYISGSCENISKIYKPSQIQKSEITSSSIIYYVPTSLRGNRHRYGPYQDIPDHYALEIEKFMMKTFGENCFVKTHPKDHYRKKYNLYHSKCITEPLSEVIQKPDIYIFDYLSTAFTQAAATSKPIIYLDLSSQNIPPSILELIKKRAVYVKVNNESDIDPTTLSKRLLQEDKSHDYTKTVSLIPSRELRENTIFSVFND